MTATKGTDSLAIFVNGFIRVVISYPRFFDSEQAVKRGQAAKGAEGKLQTSTLKLPGTYKNLNSKVNAGAGQSSFFPPVIRKKTRAEPACIETICWHLPRCCPIHPTNGQ